MNFVIIANILILSFLCFVWSSRGVANTLIKFSLFSMAVLNAVMLAVVTGVILNV